MSVADYNIDPDSNTSISGINIAEGCPPSGINNAIRQMMADIKTADGGYVKNSGSQTISGNAVFSSGVTIKGGAIVSGGMIVSGTISGTCTSAGVATKIGTATVGSTNIPVYISAGIPVSMAVVASATRAGTAASCTGNAATATSATSAGTITSTLPVSKGGTGQTAVVNNTALGGLGWSNSIGERVVTANTVAKWNGAYNTASASNLRYCVKGEIIGSEGDQEITGSIILKNSTLAAGTWPSSTIEEHVAMKDKNAVTCGAVAARFASTTASIRIYIRDMADATTAWTSLPYVQFLYEKNSSSYYFAPKTDNAYNLGGANSRWKQLYAGTTTIATSDERLKDNIAAVPDEVLNAWGDVQWAQFQFKDALAEKGENKARLHNGLVAQRIDAVFKAHGLDASRYGLFCYDEWEETPEEKDEQGNVVEEAKPAGEIYSLRYEEALCMEAAYQRRRADIAEARLDALERRLTALEAKLAGGNA